MSVQAKSPPADALAPRLPQGGVWMAVERLLVRAGDRLNPILVKESRQALKSRQFVITFALVLIFGWVWSILGLGWLSPNAMYSNQGSGMFAGYYLILAFPLLVIVPFGAFRSLASEQEDRTYELLSITALSPRQIVSGKLGSAVAQMLVYLSAISPCLAFTYLLRGIDALTMLYVLFWTILASLGLAMLALLVGTLTDERHWQVVLSVVLIVGLLLAFWLACMIVFNGMLFSFGMPFSDPTFWQISAAFLTGFATYFALVYYAAVARVTFASDNRSTRLRVIMLVQHMLFAGWMTWAWIVSGGEYEVVLTFLALAVLHWFAMGAMMTGETTELSLRVRRSLPQSFLGRAVLTWFNPGPGTGYLFAVCGALGALVLGFLAVVLRDIYPFPQTFRGRSGDAAILAFGALAVSYLVIYLGAGLFVLRLLRRAGQSGMLLTILIHIMLALTGCGMPVVVQMMSENWYRTGYSLLQMSNAVWTLAYMVGGTTLPVEAPLLLTLVPLAALGVFVLNLPEIVREVRFVRMSKPARVAEEDAELAARLAPPPQPKRISPWDVVEG
ncbi:MAG: ABC transporter permease [Pirellulales bacterium]|nr:ABC transporter permease [Pirellulales bacterium]